MENSDKDPGHSVDDDVAMATTNSTRCDGNDANKQQEDPPITEGALISYPSGAEFSFNNNNAPSSSDRTVLTPESPSRQSIIRQQAVEEQGLIIESNEGSSSHICGSLSARGSDTCYKQRGTGNHSESNERYDGSIDRLATQEITGDGLPSDYTIPRDMSDDVPIRDFSDAMPRDYSDAIPRDSSGAMPTRDFSDDIPTRDFSYDIPRKEYTDNTQSKDYTNAPIRDYSDNLPARDFSDDTPIRDFSDNMPTRDFSDDSQCFTTQSALITDFNPPQVKHRFDSHKVGPKPSHYAGQKISVAPMVSAKLTGGAESLPQKSCEISPKKSSQSEAHFDPPIVAEKAHVSETTPPNTHQSDESSRDRESPNQDDTFSINSDQSGASIFCDVPEDRPKKPIPEKEAKEAVRRMIETVRWWEKLDPDDEERKKVDDSYLQDTEDLLGRMPWERSGNDVVQDGSSPDVQGYESAEDQHTTDRFDGVDELSQSSDNFVVDTDFKILDESMTTTHHDVPYQNAPNNVIVTDGHSAGSQGAMGNDSIGEYAESAIQVGFDVAAVADDAALESRRKNIVQCMDDDGQDVGETQDHCMSVGNLARNVADVSMKETKKQDVLDMESVSQGLPDGVKDFSDGISCEPQRSDVGDEGLLEKTYHQSTSRDTSKDHPVKDYADGISHREGFSNATCLPLRDVEDGPPEDDQRKTGAIPKDTSQQPSKMDGSKDVQKDKLNRQDSNMSEKGQRKKRGFLSSTGTSGSQGSRDDNSLWASGDNTDPLAWSGDSGRSQSLFASSGGSTSLKELRKTASTFRSYQGQRSNQQSSGIGSMDSLSTAPPNSFPVEVDEELGTPRRTSVGDLQSPTIALNGQTVWKPNPILQQFQVADDDTEADYFRHNSLPSDDQSHDQSHDEVDFGRTQATVVYKSLKSVEGSERGGRDSPSHTDVQQMYKLSDKYTQSNRTPTDIVDPLKSALLTFEGRNRRQELHTSNDLHVYHVNKQSDQHSNRTSVSNSEAEIEPNSNNVQSFQVPQGQTSLPPVGLRSTPPEGRLGGSNLTQVHEGHIAAALDETETSERDLTLAHRAHYAAFLQDQVSDESFQRVIDFQEQLKFAEEHAGPQHLGALNQPSGGRVQGTSLALAQVGHSEERIIEDLSRNMHILEILPPAMNSYSDDASPDPELFISEPNTIECFEQYLDGKKEAGLITETEADFQLRREYQEQDHRRNLQGSDLVRGANHAAQPITEDGIGVLYNGTNPNQAVQPSHGPDVRSSRKEQVAVTDDASPDPELFISEPNTIECFEQYLDGKKEAGLITETEADFQLRHEYQEQDHRRNLQGSDLVRGAIHAAQPITEDQIGVLYNGTNPNQAVQPSRGPDVRSSRKEQVAVTDDETEIQRSEVGDEEKQSVLLTPGSSGRILMLQISEETPEDDNDDHPIDTAPPQINVGSNTPAPSPMSSNTMATGIDDEEDEATRRNRTSVPMSCSDCQSAGVFKIHTMGDPMPIEWPHGGVRELRFRERQRHEQEERFIASCRCHDNNCSDEKQTCRIPVFVPVEGGMECRWTLSIAKQLIQMMEKCLSRKRSRERGLCSGCCDVLNCLYGHSLDCREDRCEIPFCTLLRQRLRRGAENRMHQLMIHILKYYNYRRRRCWRFEATREPSVFRLKSDKEELEPVWMSDFSSAIMPAMWSNGRIEHGWFMDDFGKLNVEYCKFKRRPRPSEERQDNVAKLRADERETSSDESDAIGVIIKTALYNEDIKKILSSVSIITNRFFVEHFWCQKFARRNQMLICTRYQQGGSLYMWLQRAPDEMTTTRVLLSLLLQAIQATEDLHDLNILYLNWHANNLVLNTAADKLLLSNFTTAVVLDDNRSRNIRPELVSSINPRIAPPELIRKEELTRKSDCWGLGCLLYQMVEGNMPYPDTRHDDPRKLRTRIERDEHDAQGIRGPKIPDIVHNDRTQGIVLSKCWMQDPRSRCSIEELKSLVERGIQEISQQF